MPLPMAPAPTTSTFTFEPSAVMQNSLVSSFDVPVGAALAAMQRVRRPIAAGSRPRPLLPSGEARRALFHEGGHAFAVVVGLAAHGHRRALLVELRFEVLG